MLGGIVVVEGKREFASPLRGVSYVDLETACMSSKRRSAGDERYV